MPALTKSSQAIDPDQVVPLGGAFAAKPVGTQSPVVQRDAVIETDGMWVLDPRRSSHPVMPEETQWTLVVWRPIGQSNIWDDMALGIVYHGRITKCCLLGCPPVDPDSSPPDAVVVFERDIVR